MGVRLRVNTGPSEGVARSLFTGEENGDQVKSWTGRDSLPAQNTNVVSEEQARQRGLHSSLSLPSPSSACGGNLKGVAHRRGVCETPSKILHSLIATAYSCVVEARPTCPHKRTPSPPLSRFPSCALRWGEREREGCETEREYSRGIQHS